jgi:hypothetical protein
MSSPPSPSESTLTSLLTTYLLLLDTYTTQRAELSSKFSSGFLSLAHANRNAAGLLGAGRRFGVERYDEKMKAVRGVRVGVGVEREAGQEDLEQSRGFPTPDEKRIGEEENEGSEEDDDDTEEDEKTPTPEKQPDPAMRPETQTQTQEPSITHSSAPINPPTNLLQPHQDPQQPQEPVLTYEIIHLDNSLTTCTEKENQPLTTSPNIASNITSSKTTAEVSKQKPFNPLTQFHPLPPQALIQTQHHFLSSLPTMTSILNTISQLNSVEEEIWNVRRQLGLLSQEEIDSVGGKRSGIEQGIENNQDGRQKQDKDQDRPDTQRQSLPALPSPSTKQTLISRSRPAEPRSRVLKID